jgi:transposase
MTATATTFDLGIDISKESFDAALLLPTEKWRNRKFRNSEAGFRELSQWIERHCKQPISELAAKAGQQEEQPLLQVCMEATGSYSEALAIYLHEELGLCVSVVNPRRTRAYAESQLRRTKTDRVDAVTIAQFCRAQRPEAWVPAAPEVRRLQALVRHLDSLIETRLQQMNRLEAASANKSGTVRVVTDSLRSLIATLEEQIEEIKRAISSHIERHDGLKEDHSLLCSIKGIGSETSARLLAEMVRLKDYDSARKAASYSGLTPRQIESGKSVRGRTRLSKTGNARVRAALYWPAITAMRFNPLIREMGERLRERGKCEMVIIGAAMRKLVHLAYGVLKTRKPFDPEHAADAIYS